MHARAAPLALAALAALAGPAAARADVPIAVPPRFLGGEIWAALPAGPVPPPAVAGRPSRAPRAGDPCAGEAPENCVVLGPGADVDVAPFPQPGPDSAFAPPEEEPDTPADPADPTDVDPGPIDPAAGQAAQEVARAAPAVAPSPAELSGAYGGLLAPGPAAWLRWETPVLRWRPAAGAGYYNVQIFRGSRRVVNAWTRAPRLRLPGGALEQGRTYVWTVWPGLGPRRSARFGTPIGRSLFGVTLRPRLVLRRSGRHLVAETRPRIPGGVLALSGPPVRRGRAPARVRIGAAGFFRLDLGRAPAERLSARLLRPGPRPPIGLRGHQR